MCQAHILRFCCGHGILMGIQPCKLSPCPLIKTTSPKLPQQPYKCYNCQQRMSTTSLRQTSSRDSSCTLSVGSSDSDSSLSSNGRPVSPLAKATFRAAAPLRGVARQPSGSVQYCTNPTRPRSASTKSFTFSCSSSSHYPTAHYTELPAYLPHQSHPCPPCQIESFRTQADRDVTFQAQAEFPHLRAEMLVCNGRVRENWEAHLTLDKYVGEKRREEREMWLHVTRKWTQDLKKARVLVAEEDGLGLLS